MTEPRSPLDAALDLVLYAPVGLALTITEELPKLAAKGRNGLGARVTTARVVGQFAVAQGRNEMRRRLSGDASAGPASRRSTPHSAPPADQGSGAAARSATAPPAATSAPSPVVSPSPAPAEGPSAAGLSVPPAVTDLAIPGYDSLSASQVVQRLAGLTGPELEAVKEYERASRGRRTILARVGQLQAH